MDLTQLSRWEQLIAGGGLGMLAISFFPWFRMGALRSNAWDGAASSLAVIIAVALAVQVLTARFGRTQLAQLRLPWGLIHMTAGAVVMGLVLVQLALGGDSGGSFSISLDPSYGLALAAAASLAILYGGVLSHKLGGSQPPRP